MNTTKKQPKRAAQSQKMRAKLLISQYALEQSLTLTYEGNRRIRAAKEANRLSELITKEFGNLEAAKIAAADAPEAPRIPLTDDVPTRQDWLNRGIEPPETAPQKPWANARGSNRYGCWMHEVGGDGWPLNAVDRSRLIAAAPTMLQALKALEEHVSVLLELGVNLERSETGDCERVVEQACAAIAKAEGSAQ